MDDFIYYDEQRFGKPWFWISICVIDLLLFIVLYNLFTGKMNLFFLGVVSVMLFITAALDILFFLILKLTVKIDFDYIHITLAPFVFVKIDVNEISLTEITTYSRFRDYGGAGFGLIFNGKEPAYFLSGNTGVRIYYPLSQKLIVGAADPHRLINALVYAQQRKRILAGKN